MAFSYKRKDANDYDNVRLARENLDANSNYKQSDAVTAAIKARDEHAANKIGDWTGGAYGQAVKDALDKINNREKFSYDINGDALYQQYKNQYINQGRLAMADTIGQASAMTGGYGNSYAAAVGNQTYQGYLQKLNDVVPELYQMALNRYNQEGQDLKDNLTINQNLYNMNTESIGTGFPSGTQNRADLIQMHTTKRILIIQSLRITVIILQSYIPRLLIGLQMTPIRIITTDSTNISRKYRMTSGTSRTICQRHRQISLLPLPHCRMNLNRITTIRR